MMIIDIYTNITYTFDPSTVEGYGGATTSTTGNSTTLNIGKQEDGSFSSNYGTNSFLLDKAGIKNSNGQVQQSSGLAWINPDAGRRL